MQPRNPQLQPNGHPLSVLPEEDGIEAMAFNSPEELRRERICRPIVGGLALTWGVALLSFGIYIESINHPDASFKNPNLVDLMALIIFLAALKGLSIANCYRQSLLQAGLSIFTPCCNRSRPAEDLELNILNESSLQYNP